MQGGYVCILLQYYSECHGVIYVIDSCDPENLAISAQTFSKLCAWLYIIMPALKSQWQIRLSDSVDNIVDNS